MFYVWHKRHFRRHPAKVYDTILPDIGPIKISRPGWYRDQNIGLSLEGLVFNIRLYYDADVGLQFSHNVVLVALAVYRTNSKTKQLAK